MNRVELMRRGGRIYTFEKFCEVREGVEERGEGGRGV